MVSFLAKQKQVRKMPKYKNAIQHKTIPILNLL